MEFVFFKVRVTGPYLADWQVPRPIPEIVWFSL